MIVAARFVVPVGAPVIEGGAVHVEDGVIRAVGRAKDMPRGEVVDHGDAVILPGFVNAHTHLELSHLRGMVPPGPCLVDWLDRLMTTKRGRPWSEAAVRDAVEAGIDESFRAGVTTIGDITATPSWTRSVLRASGIRAVSFGEVIAMGTRSGSLEAQLTAAAKSDAPCDHVRIGISPHASYTVSPEALRICADRGHAEALPLCIHLAESGEEAEFTREATGAFAEFLRRRGVWDDSIVPSRMGPVELADRAGVLNDRCVIAHANHVEDDDIARIARTGASVAYCPRTHAAFDHPPHRFMDMLDRGVNVCIGTDSLASNPDLSVLAELRFLRERRPDCPPDQLIEMATLRGARALGFAERVGSLEPGKSADLVVVPIGRTGNKPDWDSILDTAASPAAVHHAGHPIQRTT